MFISSAYDSIKKIIVFTCKSSAQNVGDANLQAETIKIDKTALAGHLLDQSQLINVISIIGINGDNKRPMRFSL